MAMGSNLPLCKPQTIPRNVVFSYNLPQSEEFFVVGIMLIRAIVKSNMAKSKEQFEGLLRYYVKMNVGQFVKQW